MKKLVILILISVISHFITNAQSLTFTFNPKETSNNVDSIKAEVLSSGENFISRGSNEISFTITSVNINSISDDIKVYPNPSHGQTQLQFYSKVNDEINITLVNTSGQVLASNQKKIEQGFHNFKITTSHKGICIINVKGNKNRFSQKVLMTEPGGNNTIEYLGFNSQEQKEKSALTDDSKVMHFFIYSGDKITKIADSPTESKTYEVEFYECKDSVGRNYPIIQIGEQWWMAENLANNVGDGCWAYNNDENNVSTYGRLYTWSIAKTACPNGWHLPTDDEWKQMEIVIGINQSEIDMFGSRGIGGLLKATSGWNRIYGTDNFGFSALPSGNRTSTGFFVAIGEATYWWSATERSSGEAWFRSVDDYVFGVSRSVINIGDGYSVRCVKD